jgi:cytochrome o ubiquinol oxidase subunit I
MVLLIGAAMFAAVTYWFPKVFGFKLDERNSLMFFWTFVAATGIVFTAMFALGFQGETRRLDYLYDSDWKPMLWTEEAGMLLYCVSIGYFVRMLYVSLRDRVPVGPDPWGTSRTLEFLTPSPVPFYNFAVTPQVNARDELAWRRELGLDHAQPEAYETIHMPSNTGMPFIIGMLALGFGFGLTWRIWWLTGLCLLGIILAVIIRSFHKNLGYEIQPEEIAAMERNLATAGIVAEQPARTPLTEAEAH